MNKKNTKPQFISQVVCLCWGGCMTQMIDMYNACILRYSFPPVEISNNIIEVKQFNKQNDSGFSLCQLRKGLINLLSRFPKENKMRFGYVFMFTLSAGRKKKISFYYLEFIFL